MVKRAWTGAIEPFGCRSKKEKRRKRNKKTRGNAGLGEGDRALGLQVKKGKEKKKEKENRGNAGLGEGDRALGLQVELGVEVVQEARVRAHEMARFELLADPGLQIVFGKNLDFTTKQPCTRNGAL